MKSKKIIATMAFMIILILLTSCTFMQKREPQKDDTVLQPGTDSDSNKNEIDENENDFTEVTVPETDNNEKKDLPDESLQKGDQGENVLLLQEYLIDIGYPIKPTEKFDEQTTWAITDLQLQQEHIDVTGFYNKETRQAIKDVLADKVKVKHGDVLPMPKQDKSTKTIENPYDVLALINKHYALPEDYIPEDLVTPDVRFPFTEDLPKKQLRKVAADALEEMFAAGDKDEIDLFALSGYRSYDRQEAIFVSNVEQHGEKAANNFSARPGESEHQSGLTMDVTSPDINYELTIEFGQTNEGKWIKEHASDFGFIIRYPEKKEDITKYQFEPWHLRYIGKRAAREIMSKEITLEEYLEME